MFKLGGDGFYVDEQIWQPSTDSLATKTQDRDNFRREVGALTVAREYCMVNLVDGKQCDMMCASSPCTNGGSCTDEANAKYYLRTYRCACREGYEGRNCEVDKNECSSNPCKNGAKCTQSPAPQGGCKDRCLLKTGVEVDCDPADAVDATQIASVTRACGDNKTTIPNSWTCTCGLGTATPGYGTGGTSSCYDSV